MPVNMTPITANMADYAVNADGSKNGQYPNGDKPGGVVAPTNFSVTYVSDTELLLSWAGDCNRIQRSPNGSTGWVDIATPLDGVTSYNDTGLTVDTTYYYQIRNEEAGGDSAWVAANGTTTASNQLLLPAANTIASNNIALSFVNAQSASSPADTTNCGTNAPHRNAHPAIAWDYVVGVHGGRAPYYIELLQGPAGMVSLEDNMVYNATTGTYEWDANHCRLQWTNPIAGNYTVEVRVTDQDGTQVTSSWPLVVGTAGHVFVDPVGGSDAGTGLVGAPYQTFAPLASGHANEICHIYGGTVAINGANQVIDGTGPTTYQGIIGESVVIDETDGWFALNTVADACLKNLQIDHTLSGWSAGVTDRKGISQLGVCPRTNLVDISSTNYTTGPTSAANPAFFTSLGAIDEDQFIFNWDISGDQGTVIQTFKHRNSIIRKVICHDAAFANADASSNGGVIKLKDGWAVQTIDFCEIWDNNTFPNNTSCLDLAGQDQSSLGIYDTDVRYNKFHYTGSALQGGAVRIYTNNGAASITDTHLYRNSFKGDNAGDAWWNNASLDPTTANTHENENNVLENGNVPTGAAFLNTNNVEGATVRFDANMNLAAGTQRDTYLGTHGAEVAA